MPTDPVVYPVTLSQVCNHLRLDDDFYGTELEWLMAAATDYAESAMGCTLIARDRATVLSEPRANAAGHALPYGPLASVQSVTDADGSAVPSPGYVVTRV